MWEDRLYGTVRLDALLTKEKDSHLGVVFALTFLSLTPASSPHSLPFFFLIRLRQSSSPPFSPSPLLYSAIPCLSFHSCPSLLISCSMSSCLPAHLPFLHLPMHTSVPHYFHSLFPLPFPFFPFLHRPLFPPIRLFNTTISSSFPSPLYP